MRQTELVKRVLSPSWVTSQLKDWLCDLHDARSNDSFAQLYRLVRPSTVCGNARLRGLHDAIARVVEQRVPGDIVECGTAQGGSAALMALRLKQLGATRPVWVFDTFEGLPPPTRDDPDWEIANAYTGTHKSSLEDVSRLFDRLGIVSPCHLVKGRFQDTLPRAAVERIAVLHIDGDWYESVKTCLIHLYDRVSPGGVIQLDDYGCWAGARKAVDEFMRTRAIPGPLRVLDYTGRQLIKT